METDSNGAWAWKSFLFLVDDLILTETVMEQEMVHIFLLEIIRFYMNFNFITSYAFQTPKCLISWIWAFKNMDIPCVSWLAAK